MVLCFLGVAFAYALLHAELIAIMQILVYVGAISIVILFAIMLTEVQDGEYRQFFNRQAIAAAVLAALAAAAISVTIVAADIGPIGDKTLNPGVKELSSLLFNRYVLPFELVSLVLVAAMIGAIVLARKEEESAVNPLEWWLVLAVLLFCIGAYGVLARRNVIVVVMSLELMLNAVNIALVAIASFRTGRPRRRHPLRAVHHHFGGRRGHRRPGDRDRQLPPSPHRPDRPVRRAEGLTAGARVRRP